jgi:hypothetical protein
MLPTITLLLPWLVVAELLVLPIGLTTRELFTELTRALELGVDLPAVLEYTSTVRCTFEDLAGLATACELRLEERLAVDVLARALAAGLLVRAGVDRLLLELLRLEADELRLVV